MFIDIIYYSTIKDKNVNVNVRLDICARYRINLIKLRNVYNDVLKDAKIRTQIM